MATSAGGHGDGDTNCLLTTQIQKKSRLGSETSANSNSNTEESSWQSIRKNGRFIQPNPNGKFPSFGMVAKWSIFSKDNSRVPSKEELDRTLPILQPDLESLNQPVETGSLRVTWISHATLFVQMNDINILTDPIFSSRCSPVQFAGPKRYRHVPCSLHDLPRVDAVIISHSHYDHLDASTVQLLNARFGSDVRWFVPLGMEPWLTNMGCENVIELDWWDENCIPKYPDVRFVLTPAQHWCKRTPIDDNKVLWGSWCVLGRETKFFFTGDSGYCGAFEAIGNKYGPFDLAAIPIGAYEPKWMMAYQHCDPAEAVQIHQDLRAKKSVAIHWGTFNLSNEFYLEPPEKLQEALRDKSLSQDDFFILRHGETKHISDGFQQLD